LIGEGLGLDQGAVGSEDTEFCSAVAVIDSEVH